MVNTTDSFILSLLQPNSIISYTIQVVNTAGNIVGSAITGSFILPSIIPSTTGIVYKCEMYLHILITGRITAIASTPSPNDYGYAGIYVYFIHIMCYIIGLSNSAVSGITLAVSVPVTAIITAIITIFISNYCYIKSKGSYSPSATACSALYETPVSTSGVSSLEMKDNMAYGHVSIGTS